LYGISSSGRSRDVDGGGGGGVLSAVVSVPVIVIMPVINYNMQHLHVTNCAIQKFVTANILALTINVAKYSP
jgi:hypothetical protein